MTTTTSARARDLAVAYHAYQQICEQSVDPDSPEASTRDNALVVWGNILAQAIEETETAGLVDSNLMSSIVNRARAREDERKASGADAVTHRTAPRSERPE